MSRFFFCCVVFIRLISFYHFFFFRMFAWYFLVQWTALLRLYLRMRESVN